MTDTLTPAALIALLRKEADADGRELFRIAAEALERAQGAEERLEKRLNVFFRCDDHPAVVGSRMWGCPDCLVELRRLKDRAEAQRDALAKPAAALREQLDHIEAVNVDADCRWHDDTDVLVRLGDLRALATAVESASPLPPEGERKEDAGTKAETEERR